jgi:hypothetical protein
VNLKRIVFFCTCALFVHGADEAEVQLKAMIGAETSQASSSSRVIKLYMNLGANMDVGHGLRFFADAHVTSVPQQTDFPVSQIKTEGPKLLKSLKVNEMFQSAQFLTGFEYFNRHITSGEKRFQIKPVVMAGFTTALSPLESVSAVYKVTPDAKTRYPEIGSKDYFVLTTQDRDRFYFQYYGGIRIKDTKPGTDNLAMYYPAYFDITLGQNALVAGRRMGDGGGPCLCGIVWRFGAYYPIPSMEYISVFFESFLQARSGTTNTPIFLDQAANVTASDPNVAVVARTSTRDYYHFGFAIDANKLLQILFKKNKVGDLLLPHLEPVK